MLLYDLFVNLSIYLRKSLTNHVCLLKYEYYVRSFEMATVRVCL